MSGLGVSGTQAAALFVTIGVDSRQLDRGLGQAERRVQGFGSQLGGLAVAAGGVYAVREAFDATIGAAIEWESQFAGVEKTVDGTAKELASLEHELRGMAKTMPVARGELAAIAEQAGALGIATEDIGEFTEVVAQIGATTNVSSEQAATALGQLSNVLGLTQADFDNFGAALVDLGNKGASTEAQILEIASRAGAGADLIGIAADATLGWSSAVANLGIEAEAGGSSLQRFFLGAAQHVGAAGDELRIMADTARTSVGEFTALFNNDASAALQKFVRGLGELTQAEQLAVLEALGFNDVRIQRALLGLAGDVDNLTDSLEIGKEAWADNTALVEEYGKRAKTTASRIEVLGNRISDIGVRLGESSSGPVDWALTGAEMWVSGVEKGFIDLGLVFDERANALEAKLEDKGDWLRNNFMSEFLFGGEVRNQIRDNAIAWGVSIEEAMDRMEFGVATTHVWSDGVGRAFAEAAGAAEEGVTDIATSLEPLSAEMEAEMAEMREAAIAGTAATMGALLNLGNAEDYAAAWEDYLAGAGEVWTDHEREAAILGTFAGDAYNTGLHSGDSARVQETINFVNDQLAAFELLNPGVLAVGREVPASLKTGMEEIWPEVETWLEERHGLTVAELTIDEANDLGIGAIYSWWQGMQSEKQAAEDAAEAAANAVREELGLNLWESGYTTGKTWADGLWASADLARSASWEVAMAGGSGLVAFSPPKEGPLSTIDESGYNVGVTWAHGLGAAAAEAADNAIALAGAAQGPLASLLSGPYAESGMTSDVAFGLNATGGGDTHIYFQLTVEGDLRAKSERDVMDAFGRMVYASGLSDYAEVEAA